MEPGLPLHMSNTISGLDLLAWKAVLTGTKIANRQTVSWSVPINTNYESGNSDHKLWAKHALKELNLQQQETHQKTALPDS
jgi:hypothetical protein